MLAISKVGLTGPTGDEGNRSYSGRVYYTELQSTSPGTISENSVTFNESTGKFTGGIFSTTQGWRHEQPSVEITNTALKEWSATYNVSVDGTVTFPDTSVADTEFSFGTPSGAIQVTSDIESDNYSAVAGSEAGWKIERDTGNAIFNDITARGTVQSSNYSDGASGWIINDGGSAQFNDIDIRNTIKSTNFDNVGPTYAGWEINSDGSVVFNDGVFRGELVVADLTVTGAFDAADIIVENSKNQKHIVLVPIAFVSEHSETLVELDIEYKELAIKNGCKNYTRVPALGINEDFIEALSELIIKKNEYKLNEELYPPKVQCPSNFKKCPCLNYE